ncbi:CHAT domain-containing protein [Hypoxylon sp. FL1857]|nr:CHAT domain-containing protein [Hypoxylon sp. FL1857]
MSTSNLITTDSELDEGTDIVEDLLQQSAICLKLHRIAKGKPFPGLPGNQLGKAFEAAEKALAATPPNHPKRFKSLQFLGLLYFHKYNFESIAYDLSRSIELGITALDITPQNEQRVVFKASITQRILRRFIDSGFRIGTHDLEYDIATPEEIVEGADSAEFNLPDLLSSAGLYEANRFDRSGNMRDLNGAVNAYAMAVKTTPIAADILGLPKGKTFQSHDKRAPAAIGDWARQLFIRSGETMSHEDLNESIRLFEKLIEAVPQHTDRSAWLIFLGNGLWTRSWRTDSIRRNKRRLKEVLTDALHSCPAESEGRGFALLVLGEMLAMAIRHERMADVEDTIELISAIIDVSVESDGHDSIIYASEYSLRVFAMALELLVQENSLEKPHLPLFACRYTQNYFRIRGVLERNEKGFHVLDHFRQPRELLREAVAVPGMSLAVEAKVSFSLSYFLIFGSQSDKKESISLLKDMLQRDDIILYHRITAGRVLFKLTAEGYGWEEAYKISQTAVHLIPKQASRGTSVWERQQFLGSSFATIGFASDAAAAALSTLSQFQNEKAAIYALDMLETGRGVLSSSIEETRIDIYKLETRYPDLAGQFDSLRDEINSPDILRSRRETANHELDELLKLIRQKPDFDDFLTGPSPVSMREAAEAGPIIVINVSKYRCDAILIERNGIRYIPLPCLDQYKVNKWQQISRLSVQELLDVLKWLWDTVAGPVLDALGLIEKPTDSVWPRIWWVPTGALSSFPLHAAGYHEDGSDRTVLDRAISSYSPSVKSLIRDRQERASRSSLSESLAKDQAVLVAMKHTPGHRKLDSAPKEIDALRSLCEAMNLKVVEPVLRKQDVLAQLLKCEFFHFAGHGDTNVTDPLQSRLLLEDWETDSLTVDALFNINLRARAPFLAYLSACGTGRVNNFRFFDESVQLINACQLAGFRHVIGSLWEVNDESCVDMARITYETILHGQMTDSSVSLGLHNATRTLRSQWRQKKATRPRGRFFHVKRSVLAEVNQDRQLSNGNGEESSASRESRDGPPRQKSPLSWVPWVHVGN